MMDSVLSDFNKFAHKPKYSRFLLPFYVFIMTKFVDHTGVDSHSRLHTSRPHSIHISRVDQ